MKTLKTAALSAMCAGAVMLWAASAGAADNAGVNIIYPPRLASAFDKADDMPAKPEVQPIVNVKIILASDQRAFDIIHRRNFINRALYQRYLGFKRVYKGRRYPF